MGEHWMQLRTSLALAQSYKLKDSKGNLVSLWDAMETIPINSEHPEYGNKLIIKDGYTKEDGSKFTREDITKFTLKSKAINQRMHGIYNQADKNAVQKLALGRLAFMFRKWIIPSLNRRFESTKYNMELESEVEGYYRTLGRFLNQMQQDLRQGMVVKLCLQGR